MRRSLLVVGVCLLVIMMVGCMPEARARPSADFSNRTVTAEQGSSFVQELTLEGTDTNYRNLEISFEMPDGVTCPNTPTKGGLDEGKEWTFTVTFQVGSSMNPGTYTVYARGKWEEFNKDTDGWDGEEGELTKFTLSVTVKSGSGGGEGSGTTFTLSSPIVLGGIGVAVVAVAAGVFYYMKNIREVKAPTSQTPVPETGTEGQETPAKKYCRQCGAENSPNATFCYSCGKKIGE